MITEAKLAEFMAAHKAAKESNHVYVNNAWVACNHAIPALVEEIRRLRKDTEFAETVFLEHLKKSQSLDLRNP